MSCRNYSLLTSQSRTVKSNGIQTTLRGWCLARFVASLTSCDMTFQRNCRLLKVDTNRGEARVEKGERERSLRSVHVTLANPSTIEKNMTLRRTQLAILSTMGVTGDVSVLPHIKSDFSLGGRQYRNMNALCREHAAHE